MGGIQMIDEHLSESVYKKQRKSKLFKRPKKNEELINIRNTKGKTNEERNKNPILKFQLNGIQMKLIGAFIIPISFIVLLGIVSYLKASNGIISSYESASQTSLNMLGNYYNLGLQSVTTKATQINTNDSVKNYFAGYYKDDELEEMARFKDAQRLVNSTAIADNIVKNVFVFGEYGDGISSFGPLSKSTYGEFIKSKEGVTLSDLEEGSYWGGYHHFMDELSSIKETEYGLVLYRNLYNAANGKIGYIVFDVKMEFIQKSLAEVNFGGKSIGGLITEDGREIIEGNLDDFSFLKQDFVKTSLESPEENGSNYVTFDGKSYLYLYSKVKEGNATLCSLIPKDMIISQAQDVKTATVIIVIVASIIAIIIATIISSGLSGAIHQTNIVLAKAAKGDLTVRVKTKRKDEFLVLSNSITNMIGSMKSLILKMAGVSDTVSNSAEEVSSNSEILLLGTKQISASVNDINQGITQQATDAEKCLIQMESLSNQIDTLNTNTYEMNDIAHKAKNVVGTGMVIVEELNQKSKDTADITKSVIEDISHLEEESLSVNSIVDTINSIAEQTNLLSLNASIEAARAGDAGKGFAVVAGEIRKLAEQSGVAANQISQIINNMQQYTKMTVSTAKKADDIVASQETALISTIEVFNEINKHVEDLTKSLSNVSSEISHIDTTKNDTLAAIESISATSEETAAASGELGNTADQQLVAVEELNKAAERLKADAKNLEDSVLVFKVQ